MFQRCSCASRGRRSLSLFTSSRERDHKNDEMDLDVSCEVAHAPEDDTTAPKDQEPYIARGDYLCETRASIGRTRLKRGARILASLDRVDMRKPALSPSKAFLSIKFCGGLCSNEICRPRFPAEWRIEHRFSSHLNCQGSRKMTCLLNTTMLSGTQHLGSEMAFGHASRGLRLVVVPFVVSFWS